MHKCHSEQSEESNVSCHLLSEILRLSPQDDIAIQWPMGKDLEDCERALGFDY
jgi:hypothetical protein